MLLELLLELLAIVLLVLLALIVAVLLIPFEVEVRASNVGSSQEGSIAIRWLGLTLRRTKLGGRREPRELKAAEEQETEEAGLDIGRLLRILSLVRDSSSSLLSIAKSFRRAFSVRRVSVDVTFGLGDPAETAIAAGYVWSVAWILNLSPGISLSVHPDMEGIRLDGSVFAKLGVRLLPLVAAFVRAYLHRSFRMLIREVRS